MKTTKILSFVAGISLLATSLVPVKVSAASVSLSLSGATNTNGTFSAVVYENSGSARVTTAKIDLGFSGAVSNVSYDYSVGPFATMTPSGAGAAQGYVTGQQPVARVSFKVSNPGTVTTSAGGSWLKGTNDEGTQVITHSVSGGAATFTYNAPVDGGRGGEAPTPTPTPKPSTTAPTTKSTGSSTQVATNNDGTVEGDSTTAATTDDKKDDTKKKDDAKKSDDKKKTDDEKTSSSAWFWPVALLAIIAGYVAARMVRTRRAAQVAEAEKAAAAKAVKPNKKNKK